MAVKKPQQKAHCSQKNLQLLKHRIGVVKGFQEKINSNSDRLRALKEEFEELKKSALTPLEAEFYPLWILIKELLREDFIDFARWVSPDPERVEEVHEVCEKFLCNGPEALPDHIAAAADANQGGLFKYVPGATISLVEMTRGVGKTTTFHCLRALHECAKNPDYKWLITHSDKDRAKSNLRQIQGMMLNPFLALIFPELFTEDVESFKSRGGVITKEKVNVVTFNEETDDLNPDGSINLDFRKEATFTLGSPGIDRTGWHFEGIFADDLVTKDTSKDPESTKKLISYFREICVLEEYKKNWIFKIWITGTEWYINSLYTELQENDDTCSVFRMPGRWSHDGKVYFLSYLFDEDWHKQKKSSWGEWFDSQMHMRPRAYDDEGLDLQFTKDANREDWTKMHFEEMKRRSLIAQVCDPATSKLNKKKGDKKSRLTILNALVTRDMWYIYDVFSSFGEDYGIIKELNMDIALSHGTEFFIQDAQGTQGGLYDEFMRKLKKERPAIRDFKHTSSPLTSTEGKTAVANAVLRQHFLSGCLQVVYIKGDEEQNKRMDLVCSQFLGVDPGRDIIDCTVYLVADIDREIEVPIAVSNKNSGRGNMVSILASKKGATRRFQRLA